MGVLQVRIDDRYGYRSVWLSSPDPDLRRVIHNRLLGHDSAGSGDRGFELCHRNWSSRSRSELGLLLETLSEQKTLTEISVGFLMDRRTIVLDTGNDGLDTLTSMIDDVLIRPAVRLALQVLSHEQVVIHDIPQTLQQVFTDGLLDLGLAWTTDTTRRDREVEARRALRASNPGRRFRMAAPPGIDMVVAGSGTGGALAILAQILNGFVDRYRMKKLDVQLADGTTVSIEDATKGSIEPLLVQIGLRTHLPHGARSVRTTALRPGPSVDIEGSTGRDHLGQTSTGEC